MGNVISMNTANSLFWLGRYAERGYHLLHLMRKAYDEVIDAGEEEAHYSEFLAKMGGYVSRDILTSDQMMTQIFDKGNNASLVSIVERMMDNAIVLRPYISSESFSYVEMCRDFIRRASESGEGNITALQPVTDWILAFWGSVRERMSEYAYSILEIGRLVEHLDMNVRFDYEHNRVDAVWLRLKGYLSREAHLFNREDVGRLEMFLASPDVYNRNIAERKAEMISSVNGLVTV